MRASSAWSRGVVYDACQLDSAMTSSERILSSRPRISRTLPFGGGANPLALMCASANSPGIVANTASDRASKSRAPSAFLDAIRKLASARGASRAGHPAVPRARSRPLSLPANFATTVFSRERLLKRWKIRGVSNPAAVNVSVALSICLRHSAYPFAASLNVNTSVAPRLSAGTNEDTIPVASVGDTLASHARKSTGHGSPGYPSSTVLTASSPRIFRCVTLGGKGKPSTTKSPSSAGSTANTTPPRATSSRALNHCVQPPGAAPTSTHRHVGSIDVPALAVASSIL
mmetsp:Transcript_10252/g.42386  ORF Transcript_10252/g.42386 Transcript_10252/m.42386 type:complete len:287 (-) Transcript_10252:1225-2085(-)